MCKKLLCLILSTLLLLSFASCMTDTTPDMVGNQTTAESKDTLDTSVNSNTSDSSTDGEDAGNEPSTGGSSDQTGLQMDESGDGMHVSYEDFKKSEGN